MKKILIALLLSICLIIPACKQGDSITSTQIIDAHNAVRDSRGLHDLKIDPKLMAAAIQQADYLAKKDRLSHYGPDGNRPSDRILVEDYNFYMVAENIAAGYESLPELMDAWMKSKGHKTNILGNYVHVGFGSARSSGGRLYWCVLFATPKNH